MRLRTTDEAGIIGTFQQNVQIAEKDCINTHSHRPNPRQAPPLPTISFRSGRNATLVDRNRDR